MVTLNPTVAKPSLIHASEGREPMSHLHEKPVDSDDVTFFPKLLGNIGVESSNVKPVLYLPSQNQKGEASH